MTKPLGIGLIGFGGIAQGAHMPAYQKLEADGLVKVLAIADIDEAKRIEATEKFKIPNVFSDYHDLLALEGIDAVDVCTPNFAHKQPVIDAFAAGKHVICEKPIAMNGQEGAEMVAAGNKAGKKFQVALNMRFGTTPRAVKRFIDDGKIGDIYYARAHALRRRGIPGWGVFTQKDKQGGGPLIDIGVHILDMTLWLMGYPKPVSASGQIYTKFGTRAGIIGLLGQWDTTNYTVEDFAAGFVRFENGATLTIEASFAANLQEDHFESSLFGTEGGVLVNPNNPAGTRFFREESGTLTDTSPVFLKDVNTYEEELRAFHRAITDDTPTAVPGEQGLLVTHILDAIYKSAETGHEVLIP